ncbi:hypothetical protein EPA93_44845 [Ktedonosporobacter rubrisoli]|uniref:Uncharacterized protein n=1 Tax=Ktedonosporobacter rubrisoli TaxID=2509675 RepID=A0A4V0Z0C3_KTERU|nr:hypothetical protein [Ktedonosporobacter rubrisoli]QBD82721.1 hypothetical protein EPA93_44845 [Ktedonosporobacter rubrisoli]
MKMKKGGKWQQCLLALSILALIFLLVEIAVSIAATQHGDAPVRVEHVTAGPYRFTVSLYDDPARAGFALPFTIVPQGPVHGTLRYQVTSVPVGTLLPENKVKMEGNRLATLVRDSVSADPQVPGGVQGAAEITVQGLWKLHVLVDGPAGQQAFDVAVTATTLPPIPIWSGWLIGFIPVYGIVVFLLAQMKHKGQRAPLPASRV